MIFNAIRVSLIFFEKDLIYLLMFVFVVLDGALIITHQQKFFIKNNNL